MDAFSIKAPALPDVMISRQPYRQGQDGITLWSRIRENAQWKRKQFSLAPRIIALF
jgi:hypothetical protein